MPSLLYLSLMRFPNEKAHSLQIMQNCEAFTEVGYSVALWVSGRKTTPDLAHINPYTFYGVKNTFPIVRVPVLDFMPFTRGFLEKLAFYLVQFTYLFGLVFLLLRRNDEVYYTRDESIAFLLTLLKPKRNIAYEAHLFKQGGRGAWLQTQVCNRVGHVIAITPKLADDLIAQRGASPEKTLTAHDGIRAARFANLPTRTEARNSLAWSQEAFVVGFVGRLQMLDMDKGVGTLIRALREIPDAVLAIVGGPDAIAEQYRQQWIQQGSPAENFWYVGAVPSGEVPRYLCAFDVCAMPHPNTPQYANYTSPLKLFEYMASGTAVVASDLPGWSDVFRHETNALLVPPDNSQALTQAIQRLQNTLALRAKLGQQAQQDAFAHYTWNARARAIRTHIERSTS
jgi:glycosyltransferase involved in cell wall biosynthesis